MKKLISISFGVLACLVFLKVVSQAGQPVRSPKEHVDINFTTQWSTASAYPGALYAVILGSANALNDYVTCRDSAPSVNTMTAASTSASLGPRIYFSSITYSSSMSGSGNTNMVFDPPLIFWNGLTCATSAGNDQATIVYEQGRGLSGQ